MPALESPVDPDEAWVQGAIVLLDSLLAQVRVARQREAIYRNALEVRLCSCPGEAVAGHWEECGWRRWSRQVEWP